MEISSHHSQRALFAGLAKLGCILAAVGIMNIHIALYQCYAWATMLNDRIPEQGIENAIVSTFDGAHPCEKCKAVAKQRTKEQEREPIPELKPQSKSPLIYSTSAKHHLAPLVGKRLAFVALDDLPLIGIQPAVFGPPPQFV